MKLVLPGKALVERVRDNPSLVYKALPKAEGVYMTPQERQRQDESVRALCRVLEIPLETYGLES